MRYSAIILAAVVAVATVGVHATSEASVKSSSGGVHAQAESHNPGLAAGGGSSSAVAQHKTPLQRIARDVGPLGSAAVIGANEEARATRNEEGSQTGIQAASPAPLRRRRDLSHQAQIRVGEKARQERPQRDTELPIDEKMQQRPQREADNLGAKQNQERPRRDSELTGDKPSQQRPQRDADNFGAKGSQERPRRDSDLTEDKPIQQRPQRDSDRSRANPTQDRPRRYVDTVNTALAHNPGVQPGLTATVPVGAAVQPASSQAGVGMITKREAGQMGQMGSHGDQSNSRPKRQYGYGSYGGYGGYPYGGYGGYGGYGAGYGSYYG